MGGEIQLERCFVKYDETSFFGDEDKIEVYRRCDPSICYSADILNRIDGVLACLVGENGQYFREGDLGSIRGVAQCIQDLSLSDCQDCLSEASGRLRSECETSTWGEMYLGKCYIRYADQSQKNLTNNDNPTSNNEKSDREKWIPIIGAILVGGILITGLALACTNYCVCNLKGEVRNVKKDLDETKGDVKDVKNDLDETKGDVKDVKIDLDEIKGDVRNVKIDLDETKGYVKDVKKDLEKTKGDVKDVKKDLGGTKEEVKSIRKDVECGKEQIKDLRTKHFKPLPPPPPPLAGCPCPYMTHLNPCPCLRPSDPCLYLPTSNPNTCYSNPNTCYSDPNTCNYL
ncbi:hypothetical protein L1987_16312 [Smallanthus sonchifolius]|uniref:Uncharacterized protein n=1 Tax=Smallanthus sonchifolius TaxID=185202 RepID=A0ACB9J7V6_9ASTR|nr:hypothetical protein L1987_16312 [Smallanthus sonchifolius]